MYYMEDAVCMHLVGYLWTYNKNLYKNYSNAPIKFALLKPSSVYIKNQRRLTNLIRCFNFFIKDLKDCSAFTFKLCPEIGFERKKQKCNLNAILITIKILISNFKNKKNIFMTTVLIFILKL